MRESIHHHANAVGKVAASAPAKVGTLTPQAQPEAARGRRGLSGRGGWGRAG